MGTFLLRQNQKKKRTTPLAKRRSKCFHNGIILIVICFQIEHNIHKQNTKVNKLLLFLTMEQKFFQVSLYVTKRI